MARYPIVVLAAHLSCAELKQRYRQCHDAKEARRWHVLWLASTGLPIGEIATTVGLHRNWVRTVIQRYNAQAADAVRDQHTRRTGGRPLLTADQQHALATALVQRPPDGGHWTGPKVAAWIAQITGREQVYAQQGWVYLRKLGYTPQRPRPRHRQAASADEQSAWNNS
jgi:transposase